MSLFFFTSLLHLYPKTQMEGLGWVGRVCTGGVRR